MGKTMKDIQTRQQMQRSGMYRKKRGRKNGKLGNLARKGGEIVEKVVEFVCWTVLIVFVLVFILTALYIIGMVIYFRSELNKDEYVETYSEWQRMEDEIQMQALQEDAEKREAKQQERERRRRKRAWKKRNS